MGGGGGWLSQTRPIPRSPDGDNNLNSVNSINSVKQFIFSDSIFHWKEIYEGHSFQIVPEKG